VDDRIDIPGLAQNGQTEARQSAVEGQQLLNELVDAKYLLTWLSRREIRRIRDGENPGGVKLSRRQVYNIIHGRSKNFVFRNYLLDAARENQTRHSKQ
jgi:hypothetical protein